MLESSASFISSENSSQISDSSESSESTPSLNSSFANSSFKTKFKESFGNFSLLQYAMTFAVLFWISFFFIYNSSLIQSEDVYLFKPVEPLFEIVSNKWTEWNSSSATAESYHDAEETFLFSDQKCSHRVYDSFDGNLHDVQYLFDYRQYTLVFLYAEWCARSRLSKILIQQVACLSQSKDVSFIAVNCFNPKGECRKHFNLVKYPQILVHVRDGGLFIYKGPLEFNYLAKFLHLMLFPLQRIDSFKEFATFVRNNENAVVANFDFSTDEKDLFKIFYKASLLRISTDFENNSHPFCIIVNKDVWRELLDFQDESKPYPTKIMSFSSYGFQRSIKNHDKLTAELLAKWARANSLNSVQWFYPDKEPRAKPNEKNQLFVFLPRDQIFLQNSQNISKNLAIVKYLTMKENQLSPKKTTTDTFYDMILNSLNSSNPQIFSSFCRNRKMDFPPNSSPKTCPITASFQHKSAEEKNVQILLLDSNVYSNYADQLIYNSTNSSDPIVLFIDKQNETTFRLEKKFNFQNLKEFKENAQSSNKRLMKSKNVSLIKKKQKNIVEINAKQLNSILNKESAEFKGKDLLVFYFNSWCGFCRVLNFNLMTIMDKYLSRIDSFKIVKVDTGANDFPWSLHVQRLPTLVFIPDQDAIDSLPYPYEQDFSVLNLIKFVLFNANNPATIGKFLQQNFIEPPEPVNATILTKKTKLRFDLIKVLSKKKDTLLTKTKKLRERIELLCAKNNVTFSEDLSTFQNQPVYTRNIFVSLITKLKRFSVEIQTITNFTLVYF